MKKLVYIIIMLFLFSAPGFCQDSIYDTFQRQQFEQEMRDAKKKQERQMRELIESTQRAERQRKRYERDAKIRERSEKRRWKD